MNHDNSFLNLQQYWPLMICGLVGMDYWSSKFQPKKPKTKLKGIVRSAIVGAVGFTVWPLGIFLGICALIIWTTE